MTAVLANHLWQSTLFACAVALLALALRRNRAAVRYFLWFSASMKFLIPFALLIAFGTRIAPMVAPHHDDRPRAIAALVRMGEPFQSSGPLVRVASPPPPSSHQWTRKAAAAVWLIGVIAIITVRWRTWLRIRVMVRASTQLSPFPGTALSLRTAAGMQEPGVVGILRPVVLLPADIREHLNDAQLDAVLAHEQCHVRRHDNLTALMHMVVETLFWFHPLVWWVGARLVDERERACDEYVLRAGREPLVYARAILHICARQVHAPLACVSGISGSPLKQRLDAILANRTGKPLGTIRQAALAIASAAAIALPVGIGAASAPQPATTRDAQADAMLPRFDVVSVKVNRSGQVGGGFRLQRDGSFAAENTPVADLVSPAYDYPNGYPRERITGLPPWALGERYDVIARRSVASPPSSAIQPESIPLMVRSLLIDRFGLKAHIETRDADIYELRLSRSDGRLGPRLIRSDRADCDAMLAGRDVPTPGLGGPIRNACGVAIGIGAIKAGAVRMSQLAASLSRIVERPVTDRTNLQGTFDAVLTFSVEQTPRDLPIPPRVDSNEPAIFTAIREQLGLELAPTRGPAEFLVIEQIDRRTSN